MISIFTYVCAAPTSASTLTCVGDTSQETNVATLEQVTCTILADAVSVPGDFTAPTTLSGPGSATALTFSAITAVAGSTTKFAFTFQAKAGGDLFITGRLAAGQDFVQGPVKLIVFDVPPSAAPSSASWGDGDPQESTLGGDVTVGLAGDESSIAYYSVYWSGDGTTVLSSASDPILNIPKGTTTGTLSSGTSVPTGATHLLVRSRNPVSTLAPGIGIAIVDAVVGITITAGTSTARANSDPVVVPELVQISAIGTTVTKVTATPDDTTIVPTVTVDVSSGNLTYTPGIKSGTVSVSMFAEFGNGGKTPTSTYTIDILAVPDPTITSFVPAVGPGCGDTIVTITGTNFGQNSADLISLSVSDTPCRQFWWDSAAQARCLVPNDIKPGTIKLATFQTSVTSTGKFSIDSSKRESLNYVVPSSAPSGVSSVVTIAGANIDPDFSYVSLAGSNCTKVEYVNTALLLCTTDTPNKYQAGPVILGKAVDDDCGVVGAPSFTFTGPRVSSVQPRSGPTYGFLTVTVRGSYLGSNKDEITKFNIAGVDCLQTFEFIDSTELQCTPANIPGPDRGPIELATKEGGSVISDLDYEYFDSSDINPADRPVIASIEPSRVSYLGNQVITIRGQKLGETPDDFLAVLVEGQRWTAECTWVTSERVLCTTRPSTVGVKSVFVETQKGSRSLNQFNLEFTFVGALTITAKTGITDEDGTETDELVAVVNQAPVFDVLVRIFVNDSTEGAVSKPTLTFTVDSYQTPQTIGIEGVADDLRDGDQPYAVTFEVQSVDTSFESLPVPPVLMTNKESAPVLTSITPGVSPYAGREVTISGNNFDFTGLQVLIVNTVYKGSDINVLVTNKTSASTVVTPLNGPQLLQTTTPGTGNAELIVSGLVVKTPPLATQDSTDGYRAVIVANADGKRATGGDMLYYTDDCPNPGSYGRGADCGDCPLGGICKGGVRVWPKAGFWNSDEDSAVTACEPSVRCPGCESVSSTEACYSSGSAPCAVGYTGELCGLCQEGYFKANGICEECPSTGDLILLTLVAISLWVFVGVGGAVLEDKENFSLLLGFVIAVQEVASVGQLISYQLPTWLRRFYGALYLFAGDLAYLKPECSGKFTYEVLYAASITYNLAIGLPLVIGVPMMWRLSRQLNKQKSQYYKDDREDHYRNRWYRVVTIHLRIIYFAVTVKCISTVSCVSLLGDYRLITEPTTKCFTAEHSGVYVISWLLLLALTLGYPITYAYWMHKHKQIRDLDKDFMERWDFIWGPYRFSWRYLWLLELFSQFTVAVCTTTLVTSPNIQFLSLTSVFASNVLLTLVFRPFSRAWENYVIAGFNLSNIIAIVIIYLSYLDMLSDLALTMMIYILLILLLYGMGTIFVVTFYHILWVWQPRSLYRTRRQVQKELVANIEEMSLVTAMFENAPVDENVVENDRLEAYKEMEVKGTQKDLEAVAITLMFAGQEKDGKRELPGVDLNSSRHLMRKDSRTDDGSFMGSEDGGTTRSSSERASRLSAELLDVPSLSKARVSFDLASEDDEPASDAASSSTF